VTSADRNGRLDGQVHAMLGKSCDPTTAFNRLRPFDGVTESDRAEYVKAYRDSYTDECESMRKEGRL
jgi:hypothetical protein